MSRVADGREPVSVVVPTRDRPEMLDACLTALRRAVAPADEVIVVDSASIAATAVADVAARHDATLVRCDRPGVDRARNAGWRRAQHRLIAFTDDDVQVADDWCDALAGCFRARPDIAFVTGRLSAHPGQESGLGVAVKDDTEPMRLDLATRAMFGHSANLAVTRDALAAVGGFDEAMGAGGRFRGAPEGDLFDRLLGAGFVGCYDPAARAWHDQWRRVRDVVRLHYGYGIGSGARMAKLLRIDRRRLRRVAADYVWGWGLAPLPGHLVRRDWGRSACSLARLGGYCVGFARALVVPVRDGHFVSSS
jgi:glycosyltransferase involved in cell wall biosynthesis